MANDVSRKITDPKEITGIGRLIKKTNNKVTLVYDGQIYQGFPHGFGRDFKLQTKNIFIYTGYFQKRKRHGQGIYTQLEIKDDDWNQIQAFPHVQGIWSGNEVLETMKVNSFEEAIPEVEINKLKQKWSKLKSVCLI